MDDNSLIVRDTITGEQTFLCVRVVERDVGLTVSLENNGDIEVTMAPQDAACLGNALLSAAKACPDGERKPEG